MSQIYTYIRYIYNASFNENVKPLNYWQDCRCSDLCNCFVYTYLKSNYVIFYVYILEEEDYIIFYDIILI